MRLKLRYRHPFERPRLIQTMGSQISSAAIGRVIEFEQQGRSILEEHSKISPRIIRLIEPSERLSASPRATPITGATVWIRRLNLFRWSNRTFIEGASGLR